MTQISLTVGLGERAYDIIIGPELIDKAGLVFGDIATDRDIIIVSDDQWPACICNALRWLARQSPANLIRLSGCWRSW